MIGTPRRSPGSSPAQDASQTGQTTNGSLSIASHLAGAQHEAM